jgi:hypothetical protein
LLATLQDTARPSLRPRSSRRLRARATPGSVSHKDRLGGMGSGGRGAPGLRKRRGCPARCPAVLIAPDLVACSQPEYDGPGPEGLAPSLPPLGASATGLPSVIEGTGALQNWLSPNWRSMRRGGTVRTRAGIDDRLLPNGPAVGAGPGCQRMGCARHGLLHGSRTGRGIGTEVLTRALRAALALTGARSPSILPMPSRASAFFSSRSRPRADAAAERASGKIQQASDTLRRSFAPPRSSC